nr:Chain A, Prp peptide [synthetic construct]4W5Y_B Chain B, Prp peptide [synthetic construct]
GYMLGSA